MMSEQPVAEDSKKATAAAKNLLVGLCRFCLLEYPQDDLYEIYTRGSQWKKLITRVVGITSHRTDRITQMCTTCRAMVELIVNFQDLCQQTEQLMIKGGHDFSEETSWKQASGLIDSLRGLMDQHKEAVRKACGDSAVAAVEPSTVVKTELSGESSQGWKPFKHKRSIKMELCEVTVPDEGLQCEFLDEIKEEVDEENEVEDEDEQEEDQDDKDQDYEVKSEDNGEETEDDDDDEEEEKPKRRKPSWRQRSASEKQKRKEKVMCDTCGKLVSQAILEGHLNDHLGIKPYVCEIDGCGRRSRSKFHLHQHRLKHKTMMRFYDCPDCGKRIKGTTSWLRHQKLHTDEPKHACDVCGKKFQRRAYLKMHSVVHTGVALFPCEICGKRFTVKHNLGAHYKVHIKNGTYPAEAMAHRQQEEEEEQSRPAEQDQNYSMRYD